MFVSLFCLTPALRHRLLQFHWMTASLTIPFSVADIGVPLPSNLPVLNRGAGPSAQELPTAPSPKRALPPQPSPPPLPPAACAPGAKCCLNGVNYTSCQSDSLAGFFYTQLYRVANGTLHVGIRWAGQVSAMQSVLCSNMLHLCVSFVLQASGVSGMHEARSLCRQLLIVWCAALSLPQGQHRWLDCVEPEPGQPRPHGEADR